jgi:hypothetical protein
MDFLTKKAGPLPIGVWILAFAVVWWYMQNKQKKGSSGTGASNQQVDPAGAIGTIDPATGYVYGTPSDSASLAANNAGTGTGTTAGSGGSTTAGAYPDNNTWAQAAINYLVGIGIDPTAANSAIEQFLASQALTSQQQADVNSAIQRLGAPPDPPNPGTAPSPIVAPPSPGAVYAANPPSGLTTTSKASTSIGLKWNAATNATGYHVSHGLTSAATDGTTTVTGTMTSTTVTGLQPGKLYYFRVQATPAKSGAGFASLQTSTTAASSGGTPPPKGGGSKGTPIAVVVKQGSGESYSSIATANHYTGGGNALYQYNIGSTSPHSAPARAKLKAQGPNKLFGGDTVYVPRS